MNFLFVEFIVGQLLLVCSACMLLSVLMSFLFLESDILELILATSVTAIIGYSMTLHGRRDTAMSSREAILSVCGGWVTLSFCGALPYMFSGVLPPFYAILESTSGFTTVGSTLIRDLTLVPKSILFWRSMTQWLGGMGIIVLFVSFLPQYGAGAISLVNAEPGASRERVLPRLSDTAFLLWKIYTGMTVIFALILSLVGLNAFDAITHSMSSVSTGGFSVHNESIRYFNSPLVESLTALVTIGAAVNFSLYHQVFVRGWRKFIADIELRVFIALIAAGTLLIAYDLYRAGTYSLSGSLHSAFFHVSSVLSTSGLVLADLNPWPPFSKFLIFTFMFIGGCTASTAGGIKIARLIIVLELIYIELKRILHPKVIFNLSLNGQTVTSALTSSAARYLFVFIFIYFLAVAVLTFRGVDFSESILLMASIIGTAGTDVPFALLPGAKSLADLDEISKVAVTFCMLLARLEFFTVLVLLRPEFWRKTRNW
ncbi:MAG: TrkH family potassium uptake protein [Acidaminococcales bacterium]|jgi:trk system potassium uptake protein TrkH|nr:TrkH family potassium uptake protein [Acidaminococcales bacterium]